MPICWVTYPENWVGSVGVDLQVIDADGFSDTTRVNYEVIQGGVIDWQFPVSVSSASGQGVDLLFGMTPGATEEGKRYNRLYCRLDGGRL